MDGGAFDARVAGAGLAGFARTAGRAGSVIFASRAWRARHACLALISRTINEEGGFLQGVE